MCTTADTTITFAAGRYSADQVAWEGATNAPTVAITVSLFRAIFDAVGEETIDTSGDIDPGVLLGLIGLGPFGAEKALQWLRLVCQWARRRGLRVRFDLEQREGE